MKIAILGTGYAGMACGYYLLIQSSFLQITFFDPRGKGGHASQISAGILHKYAGLHSKLSPFADIALDKTKELLEIASSTLGTSPILSKGVLRPALTSEQHLSYEKCREKFSEMRWLDPKDYQSLHPNFPPFPALFIPSGLTIDPATYLKGLSQFCEEHGAQFKEETPTDLSGFDLIIYATGASINPVSANKIHPLKGQLIEMLWPSNVPPLPFTLVSQTYLCMDLTQTKVTIGSTYERGYQNDLPEKKRAIEELLPKACELFPPLENCTVINVKSALRASTPTHLPIFGRHDHKTWYLTGFGSKGLLYHAYYAERLIHEIFKVL